MRLAVVLFLGGAMFPLGAVAAPAEQAIRTSRVELPSGRGALRAELFEPASGSSRAAILVLHGAGGTLFDGPEMRRVARHLAAEGNAAYVVHYFNSTGTTAALDATMQKHFDTWKQAVLDAIAAIQQRRGTRAPVGIYGYSLGGFLAIATASNNANVGAVVAQAGGVWNNQEHRIGRMPPVLIVHGEADQRVPFTKYATPLRQLLRRRGAKVETLFFPSERHVLSPAAMAEVRPAAAKFFQRQLRAR
ncbi:hypothetical protein BH20VER2_BH20VER2_12480 [soil metagenome]